MSGALAPRRGLLLAALLGVAVCALGIALILQEGPTSSGSVHPRPRRRTLPRTPPPTQAPSQVEGILDGYDPATGVLLLRTGEVRLAIGTTGATSFGAPCLSPPAPRRGMRVVITLNGPGGGTLTARAVAPAAGTTCSTARAMPGTTAGPSRLAGQPGTNTGPPRETGSGGGDPASPPHP